MDNVFIPVLVCVSLINTIVLVGLAGIVKEMGDEMGVFFKQDKDETSYTPLVKKVRKRKPKERGIEPFLTAE